MGGASWTFPLLDTYCPWSSSYASKQLMLEHSWKVHEDSDNVMTTVVYRHFCAVILQNLTPWWRTCIPYTAKWLTAIWRSDTSTPIYCEPRVVVLWPDMLVIGLAVVEAIEKSHALYGMYMSSIHVALNYQHAMSLLPYRYESPPDRKLMLLCN